MRKYITLGIFAILFLFMLTGCEPEYSYEQTELEAVVIQCEKGTYNPDAEYLALAEMYMVQNNAYMSMSCMDLANQNGTWDYNVTVDIDGDNYTVVREKSYEVGQNITITVINTYNRDMQLVNIEYR